MENTQKAKMSPKDFFVYLATAATLYWSAGSLIALLFNIIDAAFPDPLGPVVTLGSGSVRFAVASLLIIFPLYLVLSWIVRKDVVRSPEKYNLAIRRWFVYFTLFLAGAAIIIDLVALLNTFLGGEITIRFVLKALSVAFVAAAIFGYYFYDLRRAKERDMRVRRSFVAIAALAVLAVIVSGFVVMGTPGVQRDIRLDRERVQDLSLLQSQLVNYWQRKGQLPVLLSQLENALLGFSIPTDPETGEEYGYTRTGSLSFELCATFARESADDEPAIGLRIPIPEKGSSFSENWQHNAGRECFARTIDPELFPRITQ